MLFKGTVYCSSDNVGKTVSTSMLTLFKVYIKGHNTITKNRAWNRSASFKTENNNPHDEVTLPTLLHN